MNYIQLTLEFPKAQSLGNSRGGWGGWEGRVGGGWEGGGVGGWEGRGVGGGGGWGAEGTHSDPKGSAAPSVSAMN